MLRRFYRVLCLATGFFGWNTVAQADTAVFQLKYHDLPKLIEQSHPLLQAKRLQIEADKRREGRFSESFKPQLELSTSMESFQLGDERFKTQPTASAIAVVNLYNGGRDRLEDSKANAKTQRSEALSKNLLRNRLANIRKLYWEYLYWQQLIVMYEEAIGLNQGFLRQAKQRIAAGRANATDRVEFEMQTVALSQQREDARLEMKRTAFEITLELGLESHIQLKIQHPYQHEHDASVIELHNEQLEQELIAGYNAEIALKELELASLERYTYPQVDLFGGWNQFNERERDGAKTRDRLETLIGIRLSMTLDTSKVRHQEIGALQLERQAVEQERLYRQREIEQEFIADSRKMKLLHEQIHGAQDNVTRAQSYLKLTLDDYQRGVKNSSDVVGAAEKKFSFQVILAQKIRDYEILKGHILSEIGR